MGLLHKIQLGEAHPGYEQLFPRIPQSSPTVITRRAAMRHKRQFLEVWGHSYYLNHSIFGAARVYNVLPEHVVSAESVKVFQSRLSKDAKHQCEIGKEDYKWMYCCRRRSL